jgi:TBC1 domain family protein 5
MYIGLSFSLLEGESIPSTIGHSINQAYHTQTFLLSTAAEGLSWSQVLDNGREFYTEQRDHFLKYIKHPEALAELSIDPLTEDPTVRLSKLRDGQ